MSAGRASAPTKIEFHERMDAAMLPRPVADLIDAIMVAVHAGRIEELRTALEWNELPPALAVEKAEDPIAFLKKQSHDGEGREILAVLARLLSVGPARQPLGRDLENNDVYIWPYLAELDIDKLTPTQQVDLYRLVPADVIGQMRTARRWTWYRLVIGADGTWHAFMPHK